MRLALFGALVLLGGAANAATLNICVKRLEVHDEDFNTDFEHGPIRLPAGSVFDLGGPAFGPASDPKDEAHEIMGGWSHISKGETDRRFKLIMDDLKRDQKHTAGLVTLSQITLTKTKPCASVEVSAAHSIAWGWTISPVFGSDDTYYQLYGVVRDGALDTHFTHDADPVDFAGARGALNGILKGTTDKVVDVPD